MSLFDLGKCNNHLPHHHWAVVTGKTLPRARSELEAGSALSILYPREAEIVFFQIFWHFRDHDSAVFRSSKKSRLVGSTKSFRRSGFSSKCVGRVCDGVHRLRSWVDYFRRFRWKVGDSRRLSTKRRLGFRRRTIGIELFCRLGLPLSKNWKKQKVSCFEMENLIETIIHENKNKMIHVLQRSFNFRNSIKDDKKI